VAAHRKAADVERLRQLHLDQRVAAAAADADDPSEQESL